MLKNLFNTLVGALSVTVNKRETFINFASQYLKPMPQCREILLPYLPQLVDIVLEYSEKQKQTGRTVRVNDETDLLEYALGQCAAMIKTQDVFNLIHSNYKYTTPVEMVYLINNFLKDIQNSAGIVLNHNQIK